MSRRTSKSTMTLPAPLRPATLRAGMALAIAASLAAFAVRLLASGI